MTALKVMDLAQLRGITALEARESPEPCVEAVVIKKHEIEAFRVSPTFGLPDFTGQGRAPESDHASDHLGKNCWACVSIVVSHSPHRHCAQILQGQLENFLKAPPGGGTTDKSRWCLSSSISLARQERLLSLSDHQCSRAIRNCRILRVEQQGKRNGRMIHPSQCGFKPSPWACPRANLLHARRHARRLRRVLSSRVCSPHTVTLSCHIVTRVPQL